MKIIYNKTDIQNAIVTHLEKQGMSLEGKVVSTERVKDLIHVSIEEEGSILEEDDTLDLETKNFMDNE